ncbi:MAG: hypothetical protein WBQ23_00095 [Bacteroidota bacterium]
MNDNMQFPAEAYVYVLNLQDRIMLDAVKAVLTKLKDNPVRTAGEAAVLDTTLQLFNAMPSASQPCKNQTVDIRASWAPAASANHASIYTIVMTLHEGGMIMYYSYGSDPLGAVGGGSVIQTWYADYGSKCDLDDHFFTHRCIDGVKPFHQAVYSLSPETEVHMDCKNYPEEEEGESNQSYYPKTVLSTGTEVLPPSPDELFRALADKMKAGKRRPERIPAPVCCDLCDCAMNREEFLVDGMVKNSLAFADMCVRCAILYGSGIGRGIGQLYQRCDDGAWRCVAGLTTKF